MNKDILTYAREIALNNPPCLISPLEFRRVIGELADRLEHAESALRRIHAVCVDDTRSPHWRIGHAEGTAELAAGERG